MMFYAFEFIPDDFRFIDLSPVQFESSSLPHLAC